MQSPTIHERTYTLDQVAELLQISYHSAYKLAITGELRHLRVGRFIRVTQQHLDQHLGTDRGKLQAELDQRRASEAQRTTHAASQTLHNNGRIVVQITCAKGKCTTHKALTSDQAKSLVKWLFVAPDIESFTVSKG